MEGRDGLMVTPQGQGQDQDQDQAQAQAHTQRIRVGVFIWDPSSLYLVVDPTNFSLCNSPTPNNDSVLLRYDALLWHYLVPSCFCLPIFLKIPITQPYAIV